MTPPSYAASLENMNEPLVAPTAPPQDNFHALESSDVLLAQPVPDSAWMSRVRGLVPRKRTAAIILGSLCLAAVVFVVAMKVTHHRGHRGHHGKHMKFQQGGHHGPPQECIDEAQILCTDMGHHETRQCMKEAYDAGKITNEVCLKFMEEKIKEHEEREGQSEGHGRGHGGRRHGGRGHGGRPHPPQECKDEAEVLCADMEHHERRECMKEAYDAGKITNEVCLKFMEERIKEHEERQGQQHEGDHAGKEEHHEHNIQEEEARVLRGKPAKQGHHGRRI